MDKTKAHEALSGRPIAKNVAPFANIISRARGPLHAECTADEPVDHILIHLLGFFDACAGPANETIGTTILEVAGAFGMHPELLRLIRPDAGFANGLLHPPRQRRQRERS